MASCLEQVDAQPPLKDVIAQHDLRADKALGQNFLLDQNITDKIVRCADRLVGVSVIEIGPGPGGLTRSLLRADTASVTAVEFDPRAVAALQALQEAAGGHLSVVQGDAMALDVLGLVEAPRAIVANLPYNIATVLLTGWLEQLVRDGDAFQSMTLMFQKEVADRIVAPVGTKPYGRLSVICQWLCHARQMYILPPSAFSPPPKVNSAVVHFKPINRMVDMDMFKMIEAVTRSAFGQRRKMIRSSMKEYLPEIEQLELEPTLRAENLTVENYVAIAALRLENLNTV